MTHPVHSSISGQTRTAPHIRWLVNKIAVIKGDLARLDKEQALLEERRQRLLQALTALENVCAQVDRPELRALAPVVKAHNEKYGGRGHLRRWVRDVLQSVAPEPIDTFTLLAMAEATFQLEFSSSKLRRLFCQNTLGRALRAMLANGEVERLHHPETANKPGVWRWAGDRKPSLQQLAGSVQEVETWR